MIGLAVGIDYALFLVTRHRARCSEGMEFHESIARAVGTAGTAVVFAGCTVVVALLSLFVAGIPLVSALGYTAAVAVATAVLAAITLLPALMSLAGRRINSLALPARLRGSDDPDKQGVWGRWAGFVTKHPLIPVLFAVALMVPLIIPVLSLELGQEDIGQTNPATMERKAYDLMAKGYGPGFNGPLIIAVAVAPKAKGDPEVVDQENQLKALQKTLEQEQKEGNQQQAEITAEQAQLEQQQQQLEQKQALLNQQAAELQAQQAQLEAAAGGAGGAGRAAAGAGGSARGRGGGAEAGRQGGGGSAGCQPPRAGEDRAQAGERHQPGADRASWRRGWLALKAREKQLRAELRADGHQAVKLIKQAESLKAQKAPLEQQKQRAAGSGGVSCRRRPPRSSSREQRCSSRETSCRRRRTICSSRAIS